MLPSPSVHTVRGRSSGTAAASTFASGTSLAPGGTGLSNPGSSEEGGVLVAVVSVGPLFPGATDGWVEAQAVSRSSAPAPMTVPRLLMSEGRSRPRAGLLRPFHSYPFR
ncbi:hypothetical protein GCM10010492_49490 [Saccharothrix mutabilis subsp. mutabilis]|uniref:Secreted protein n=1 Tax=Saccharothrix mutabilis subsp. mutabilis TaxID=66855 RepID=A0ABN0UAS6_9PSEU